MQQVHHPQKLAQASAPPPWSATKNTPLQRFMGDRDDDGSSGADYDSNTFWSSRRAEGIKLMDEMLGDNFSDIASVGEEVG